MTGGLLPREEPREDDACRRVVVVIVTYFSAEVIEDCLRALPDALEGLTVAAITIADNASADATVERALGVCPDAVIINTGGNLGYAAAINRAQAAAPDHDLLLILNPDTRLGPGSVGRLADALEIDPRGMAVPRTLDLEGRLAYSLRREPSVGRALAEALLGGDRAGRRGWGEVVGDARVYAVAGPTAWASGSAVLVTRRCWDEVGPWDERYFLYSEETEYMLRARDRGFVTWYVPEAVVMHKGGESGTSPQLWSLLMANRVRLFRSRHGVVRGALFWLVLALGEGGRAVAGRKRSRAAVRRLVGPRTPAGTQG